MHPKIEVIGNNKLVGMHMSMSMAADRTRELFSAFMPGRKDILHAKNENVFDLKVYPGDYFQIFDPSTMYVKWALIEVSEYEEIPTGMAEGTCQKACFAATKKMGQRWGGVLHSGHSRS